MPQTEAQRFRSLALQTNRQFAHAVIFGGMSREEASAFGVWVCREKLNGSDPGENLLLYYSEGENGTV